MNRARTAAGPRTGSRRRSTAGRRGDGGTATAELAVCLPALVLLFAVGLGGLAAVRDQIEAVAAARETALAHARGEAPPPVAGTVEVSSDGDLVRVTVRRHHEPLGGLLPGIEITATAVAAVEPGQ